MSIFKQNGVDGRITTIGLPSGDMAVTAPFSGPLEGVMFAVCRTRGYRNPHGGWIVKSTHVAAAKAAFASACIAVTA